jgi:hypothetical protein
MGRLEVPAYRCAVLGRTVRRRCVPLRAGGSLSGPLRRDGRSAGPGQGPVVGGALWDRALLGCRSLLRHPSKDIVAGPGRQSVPGVEGSCIVVNNGYQLARL